MLIYTSHVKYELNRLHKYGGDLHEDVKALRLMTLNDVLSQNQW